MDIHHKLQYHQYKDMPFIDGLPSYKMAGSFHGKLSVSHNQMVLVIFQFHSHHFPQDPGSPPWQNLNPKRDSRCINSTMKNRLGSSLAWLRHVGSFESSGSPWADMGRTHGENSEFTKKKSCWMVVMIIITIMMMMIMMMMM